MLLSVVLYVALLIAAIGALSVLRPLRFIGIRTRVASAQLFGAALLVAVIIMAWPARESHAAVKRTRLDEAMPRWQFEEFHSTHVAAPPEKVFAAIHAVTADEILWFRTLTAIRRGFRRTPESILNPRKDAPILDVATSRGFRYVADESPHEVVVRARVAAGAEAMMNFVVTPDSHGGSNVSTETRVYAANKRSEHLFAMYWRAIRPGSDIIRRMWLRAIRLRAEA